MSRNGQVASIRAPQRPVAVFALDFPQGKTTGRHAHPFAQLVYAAAGVMRVLSESGTWIVPPGRAVWIPARLPHEVQTVTSVQMRTVYLVEDALVNAPRTSAVVPVSSLLRELILEALRLPRPYPLGGAEERLIGVLLDQIAFERVVPLHLPRVQDARLLRVVQALEMDPSAQRTVRAWARTAGMSSRNFARAFRRETGLSFGAWRAQLRLLRALELLAVGDAVTEVALSLGYESTSAFIQRFRRHLGTTPARYFPDRNAIGRA